MTKHWSKQQEKGGIFFLNITAFLVRHCPKFLLDFIIKSISFVYFILSKKERDNIKSYRNHLQKFSKKTLKYGIYKHFLSFAKTICDKFAVWQEQIDYESVILKNETYLIEQILNAKKGQIILVSHLGNIEIATVIGAKKEGAKINILVYNKHANKLNKILNSFQKIKTKFIYVDKLNIQTMLELKSLIDKGEHIGIMGDRIPIRNGKTSKISFLGKEAVFPQGAFLLSGLLNAKISTLWIQRINGVYEIELCPLCEAIKLDKDKTTSIKPYLQKYIKELEKRCIQTPYQWYNFYDFWSEHANT